MSDGFERAVRIRCNIVAVIAIRPVGSRGDAAGAAHLVLAQGVAQLDPARAVFDGMLAGWWRSSAADVERGDDRRRASGWCAGSREFTNEYPWAWRAQDVEAFTTSLRSDGLAHSTIRGYHDQLGLFGEFVCDRRYGWVEECEQRFGRAPAVICHEWNTAVHASEFEGRPGRRALTARGVAAVL